MFNCPGMLFFPLPLWLYLGLKILGLIPVQNSICPFSHRLQNTQTCLVLQVSWASKGEGIFAPKGFVLSQHLGRNLSLQDQDPWPRGSFPQHPRWGLFPVLWRVRHVPGWGKQSICFGNLLPLNLWSLLSKLSWKPSALQQLQAVVLCLCEVTSSTPILCGECILLAPKHPRLPALLSAKPSARSWRFSIQKLPTPN